MKKEEYAGLKIPAEAKLGITLVIILVLLFNLGFFEPVEMKLLDARFLWRGEGRVDRNIVIVPITDECLNALGSWPFPRRCHARVIDFLTEAGARVVAFDILFSLRSEDTEEDELLLKAIKKNGKVVLAEKFTRGLMIVDSTEPSDILRLEKPFEEIEKCASGVGLINIDYERYNPDGVLRKIALLTELNQKIYPAFSLEIARIAAGAATDEVKFRKGKILFERKNLKVESKQAVAEIPLIRTNQVNFSRGVPRLDSFDAFLINYAGPYNAGIFERVPYHQLYSGRASKELFRDKIVIIGAQAQALPDADVTPFGLMPGPEINATIVKNILDGCYLRRPPYYLASLIIAIPGFLTLYFLLRVRPSALDIIYFLLFSVLWIILAFSVFMTRSLVLEIVPAITLILVLFVLIRFYQLFLSLYFANRELAKKLRQLESLYSYANKTAPVMSLPELLRITVLETTEMMGCRRCSIVLRDEKTKKLIIRVGIGMQEGGESFIENLELRGGSSLIEMVMDEGQPLLIRDITSDCRISEEIRKKLAERRGSRYETGSFMCVPLIAAEKVIGAISVTDKKSGESFGQDEMMMLVILSRQIVTAIDNVRLYERLIEQKRIEKELEIARNIQFLMSPRTYPDIEGLDICTAYRPAREVSGDYFDLIKLSGNRLGLAIGDVSGKGVPACLIMTMLRSVLRAKVESGMSPDGILTILNSVLKPDMEPGMFITFIYGVVDPGKNLFSFANAGHNEIILHRAGTGEFEFEARSELVMGVLEELTYHTVETDFNPGDTLIMYTDGITEALNRNLELYGMNRFMDVIKRNIHLSCQEMVDAVIRDIELFQGDAVQSDDITLVVVKRLK